MAAVLRGVPPVQLNPKMVTTNRNMIYALFLAIAAFQLISAAVYNSALPGKPEEFKDQEGCYVMETNTMLGFGEQATPLGMCFSVECSRDRLNYETCITVGTEDPQCYITDEDVSQPYPACCPTIKCESNDLL